MSVGKDTPHTMAPPVVLGVDGGGTKTHYALFDTSGRPIDFFTSGPTNHESLPDGFTGLRNRLETDLETLFTRNGLAAGDVANASAISRNWVVWYSMRQTNVMRLHWEYLTIQVGNTRKAFRESSNGLTSEPRNIHSRWNLSWPVPSL